MTKLTVFRICKHSIKEAVQRKDDLEQALVRAKIQVQDYEGQLEDLEERLAKAGNR